MNFCVGDIKHIKTTENKLDLECVLRSRLALFLVPNPAAQILHPDCDLKTMPTLDGSL